MEAVLDPLALLSNRTTAMTEQSTGHPKVSLGKDLKLSNVIFKVLPNGSIIPSWTTTATMRQVLKQIVGQWH